MSYCSSHECWTFADKSQRNASVSESVGRDGDGNLTMVTADSKIAL